jgi:hypothetical protein
MYKWTYIFDYITNWTSYTTRSACLKHGAGQMKRKMIFGCVLSRHWMGGLKFDK